MTEEPAPSSEPVVPAPATPEPAPAPGPKKKGTPGATYIWGTGRRKASVAQVRIRPGSATLQAVGRYAAFSQLFGSFDGASSGPFEELFAVSGSGFVVDGESGPLHFTGDWRWGRGGGGGTWSSLASDNDDDDHMVTYRVEGLANGADATWLLFWEDLPGLGDQDYNDLVIEVMAIVPLPPAAWLGSLGLIAVVVLRRKIF